MSVITICSSASFYQQVVDVQSQLEEYGHTVLIPATAIKMKQTGDFDVSKYKTWFGESSDYHKKTALMRGHFAEIEKGDSILVLNYEKHGSENYIGGNVLMEMTIAFYLHKPIFILNQAPQQSPFLEEIMGMNPLILNGDIQKLGQQYDELIKSVESP